MTVNNCEPILQYMTRVAEVPYSRTMSMLRGVMPSQASPFFFFRVALMILEYLPCFEKDDVRMEAMYDGSVPIWAHTRVLSAGIVQNDRVDDTQIVMLLTTSPLAGSIKHVVIRTRAAIALLRKAGMGRSATRYSPPAPQELTGAYLFVKFGNVENRINVPVQFDVTSSEKSENKKLMRLRIDHSCGKNGEDGCPTCPVGRDRCALSCRITSVDHKVEECYNEPSHRY